MCGRLAAPQGVAVNNIIMDQRPVVEDLYRLSGGQCLSSIAAEETACPEKQGRADAFTSLFRVRAHSRAQFFRENRFGECIKTDRIVDLNCHILQFFFYVRNHHITTIFLMNGIRYNKKIHFSSENLLESANLRAIF